MAFICKDITDISVPVTVHTPGDDEPSEFRARWRLHPWEEAQKLREDIHAGNIPDEELIENDLLDLLDVLDADGKPLSDSGELRRWMLSCIWVRRPLIASWFAAQSGYVKEASKN